MPKHNAEVAGHFFADSVDYLDRASMTEERFESVKSTRLKWFTDVRLAYECALKAVIAEAQGGQEDGSRLPAKIEGYRHNIEQLEGDAFPLIPLPLRIFGLELKGLPVGLRYRIDCWDFIETHELEYYKTVGSTLWVDSLIDQTQLIIDFADKRLEAYRGVATDDEALDALLNARPPKCDRN